MPEQGLSARQRVVKRAFDLVVAVPALVVASPVIVVAVLAATIETRAWGLFSQVRIGREARPFRVYKVRTMRVSHAPATTVTTLDDARITRSGAFMRSLKIDELPQLLNVVLGQMSLVGPRPDVPGFADALEGGDRVVLTVRPGITGPATLAFRHEEELLAAVEDPEAHNATVIWPQKVALNRAYVESWSLRADLRCLLATLGGRGLS